MAQFGEDQPGPRLEPPTWEEIEDSYETTGLVEAACSERCMVETDGECPHGKRSWFEVLGGD